MNHALRPTALAVLVVVLAACSAGAASAPPSQAPVVGPSPAASGEPGEPGTIGQPQPGDIQQVEPQPGQQNVHPVALERMNATASGLTVSVDAYWTSGVEPCYVLDQVIVNINKDDQTVDVTIQEGTSDPNAICVMMAVAKHTTFSFDVPSGGTWTIQDSQGGAAPVEVTTT